MAIKLASPTLEYIRVAISGTENGVLVDVTIGGPPSFAFLTSVSVEPTGGDWQVGEWEVATGPIYYARILIGPGGGIVLAEGRYYAWVKWQDNPEVPARRVGVLTIT